ncbi:MAG: hypothetical protein IIY21_20895 [Clostridiales bacterium]|nr:hypothetical protein [Clostridiales bacterium]
MTVNTNEYEFAYGKKPRGYGYWFFYDSARKYHTRRGAYSMTWEFSMTGLYSECKKAAIKSAREYGFDSIIVSS